MKKPMEIQELRTRIDAIDRQIVELYGQRMETATAIGRIKRERGLPVDTQALTVAEMEKTPVPRLIDKHLHRL